MTHSDQLREDLHFVRAAVARRDGLPPVMGSAYYIWAVYVLVGYTLLDINVAWANGFFALAWFPCVVGCGIARKFWAAKYGEVDSDLGRKSRMHFLFGSLLAVVSVVALACVVPAFRGPITGQVMVILFGMIYFLAGVHFDRSFLWLGPVLMIGGVCVGLIPHFNWTALGVVIASGLCIVAMINSRRQRSLAQAEAV